MSPELAAGVLVAALVVLWFQGWRALLFLRPGSARVEVETPADVTTVPEELADTWGELQKLGFTLLGVHSEKTPLAPRRFFLDGVHATEPVNVSLPFLSDGPEALVAARRVLGGRDEPESEGELFELVTQSDRGFVFTANYKRLAREVPGAYLSGGLDGASPERVLKAHLRRVPEVGTPKRLETLDSRVLAAREWYARSGKPELRQQHAVGLLWTLGALGMVCAALLRLLS
jgi:hypothetical protein